MKDNLAGDLSEDWGSLSVLHDIFLMLVTRLGAAGDHAIYPRWRGEDMDLVSAADQGSASCTGSAALLAYAGIEYCALHIWTVHAELEDCKAYRSGPGGPCLGAAVRTAYYHGFFCR